MKGEEITFDARAVSICDALRHDLRTIPRNALDFMRAKEELMKNGGTQLDPKFLKDSVFSSFYKAKRCLFH